MIKIELEIQGGSISLSMNEAKELYLELDELFGKKSTLQYPPGVRVPAFPETDLYGPTKRTPNFAPTLDPYKVTCEITDKQGPTLKKGPAFPEPECCIPLQNHHTSEFGPVGSIP